MKFVCQECGAINPHETMVERFWNQVSKGDGPDDCWEWIGCVSPTGYGSFNIEGKSFAQATHRVSYEMAFGPIPKGMFICHKCDNPPCVRPDHLFLGTPADNWADMLKKRRRCYKRGEDNPNAKLTLVQVLEMKTLYPTLSHRKLAKKYGVSKTTIAGILKGEQWKSTVKTGDSV